MNKKLIISLVMIGILAFGAGLGTFAWFTSTAASTGGTFTAGTLKIDVNGSLDNDEKFAIIPIDKMAPGDDPIFKTLTITNEGNLNLAMFKKFSLSAPEGMTPEQAEALAKQILVTSFEVKDWSEPEGIEIAVPEIWNGNNQWDAENDGRATLYDLTHATRELGGGWFGIGLMPGETQTITIGLQLDRNAGNDVQGLATNLGVEVVATQVNDDAIKTEMQGKGMDLNIDFIGNPPISYFDSHFTR